MRQYELTYLISDNVSESDITKVTGKIGGFVSDEGGKVLKEESWGRRKLAYPINKQLFATYITTGFELAANKLIALEREIKHENDVIRHLLVVKEIGKEKLTLTAEDIAATEEIEKVVGGEKSFEAVIGETEESKDLMAVRGDSEAENTNDKTQDTNKSQISKAETAKEENNIKEVEVNEDPAEIKEIVKEKPEIVIDDSSEKLDLVEKPVKKTIKKIEDKKVVIASEAKQSDSKKIAAAEDILAMTDNIESKEITKKPVKKKAIKKDDSVSDEADRLTKLNKELDDILGEDL